MSRKLRRQRKRSAWDVIRWVLATLLFTVGIALLLVDPIKNWMIQRGQTQNAIANISREQIVANEQKSVTYNFEDVKTLNAYDVIKQNVNPKDLPVVGAVAIPSVKMNLPIYKGVSEEGMYLGAGTLLENQKMGVSNYPIASHHSIHKGLLFEPLTHVENGATVYLTDLDKIYEYEVFSYQVVDPYRVDVLNPTDTPIITMITCDSSLENRVVVQAKLVKTIAVSEATPETLSAFELATTVPE